MISQRVLGLMVAASIGGCAPFVDVVDVAKVPRNERVAAIGVRVIPIGKTVPAPVQLVGPVEATSCKVLMFDRHSSVANALEQLKIKTLRMGANAIIDLTCSESGTDLATNCWDSVTCGGAAVKLADN